MRDVDFIFAKTRISAMLPFGRWNRPAEQVGDEEKGGGTEGLIRFAHNLRRQSRFRNLNRP
jgi:hypothetical protein